MLMKISMIVTIVLIVFVLFEFIFRKNRSDIETISIGISCILIVLIIFGMAFSSCSIKPTHKNIEDMTNKEYQEYLKWNREYDKRQWENKKAFPKD